MYSELTSRQSVQGSDVACRSDGSPCAQQQSADCNKLHCFCHDTWDAASDTDIRLIWTRFLFWNRKCALQWVPSQKLLSVSAPCRASWSDAVLESLTYTRSANDLIVWDARQRAVLWLGADDEVWNHHPPGHPLRSENHIPQQMLCNACLTAEVTKINPSRKARARTRC